MTKLEIGDRVSVGDAELLQDSKLFLAKCFDDNEVKMIKDFLINTHLLTEEDFEEGFDTLYFLKP